MTTSPESPVYAAILEGIGLREQGRPTDAKALMEPLVADVESGEDAFAKVFLAHSLADVQEEPEDELAWDLRALAFMDELTDQQAVGRGNAGGKNALLPSLHLNLAEDYRRLGDEAGAHRHFELGKAYLEALSGDAYGDSIRSAFAAWRSSS
ncbi:hypothetical protein [Actinoplanes sp. NBRC 103695]|uniref:hypothetical protein n=1 Tax=Actinoplanes sp. NBRC 103695 TaxID=3032202 RepID=UPI0024A56336|nr:hypothetical protein [Actinoplanes sp. NBRC 103695]GLY97762.1 hypothetical protein Acsp02_50160 [Actinoplanes sp. NBRC 103695]